MPEIKEQKKLIKNSKWNCLVVLDACRYDFFKDVYDDYLDGFLRKVISPGSGTPEWLKKNFNNKDFTDVVYVSGNPFINSKGLEIVENFNGMDNFYKIIDVWDGSWDDSLKTVPPAAIGKALRMARAQYPNRRLISHFMQPHYPYLSIGPIGKELGNEMAVKRAKRGRVRERDSLGKIRGLIGELAITSLGKMRVVKLRKALGLKPAGEIELVEQKYGKKGLRKAYEDNLKTVLEEVAKVASRLPGKVVVTADHGELLGEEGLYGHPPRCDTPYLREVPWLEVN